MTEEQTAIVKRLCTLLQDETVQREVPMFGGIAFMVNEKMTATANIFLSRTSRSNMQACMASTTSAASTPLMALNPLLKIHHGLMKGTACRKNTFAIQERSKIFLKTPAIVIRFT